MEIRKVRLKRNVVFIEYWNDGETHKVSSPDNPLPSFVKAVENLGILVLDLLHLPSDYIHGLSPQGITLVSRQGTELVAVVATKELNDCSSPLNITTPLRFLSVPEEEGTYSPPLKDAQVDLINEVVREAKNYVGGQRAQGQLPLGDDKPEKTTEESHEAETPQLNLPVPEKTAKKPRKNAKK